MLFAQGFGESVFWSFVFLAIGLGAVGRLFKKFDTGGQVQDAAKKGIINVISRWLK